MQGERRWHRVDGEVGGAVDLANRDRVRGAEHDLGHFEEGVLDPEKAVVGPNKQPFAQAEAGENGKN